MNSELNKKQEEQIIASVETVAANGAEISEENLDHINGGVNGTRISNDSIITCPKCGLRYAPAFTRCRCR